MVWRSEPPSVSASVFQVCGRLIKRALSLEFSSLKKSRHELFNRYTSRAEMVEYVAKKAIKISKNLFIIVLICYKGRNLSKKILTSCC